MLSISELMIICLISVLSGINANINKE